ncbi:MAG: hypothetical protein PHP08_01310 [Candidatus Dojkabacteria bacterium]|nr:hypothetical protein [Candidatus Dojkabacteria bacterium]
MKESNKHIRACIYKLYDFRSNIPANLLSKKINEVWNIKDLELKENIEVNDKEIKRKINIVKKSLHFLLCKNLVKFIAVSGSVGSEFSKKEDDIDLFIIVKNDTAWIYRLYLYMRNLSRRIIRSKERVSNGENVKDKFCINLITEERALLFEDDIFNLNELLYIKPVYNENFLNVIYLNNPWLKDKYFVSDEFLNRETIRVGDVKGLSKRNYLLIPINFFLFILQIFYMSIMRHQPDYKRLWKGFLRGRIEFFPKEFREEKIKNL